MKKLRKILVVYVFLIVISISMEGNAYADDINKLDDFFLDEVVVTATRAEKSIKDVPASVSVITADDIKKMGISNIDEALVKVPGVYIPRLSGMASTISQTAMRGNNAANSTLVMVDGQAINDSYNGSVTWSSIPVDKVERIEVLRGPGSTLYGSSAMGGVINIITKDNFKAEGNANIKYESNSTWDYSVDYNDKVNDKFSVGVLYEKKKTSGYVTDNTLSSSYVAGTEKTSTNQGDTRYIIGNKGKRQWDEDNYGIRLKQELDQNRSLKFNFLHNEYEYTYSTPQSYIGDDVFKKTSSYFSSPGGKKTNLYSLNYEDKANMWNITTGINDTTDQYNSTISKKQLADNPNSRYFIDMQKNYVFSEKDKGVFGLHFSKDKMRAKIYSLSDGFNQDSKNGIKSFADGNAQSLALYGQGEHKFAEKFSMIAGLRYDKWKTDGAAQPEGKSVINYDEESFSYVSPTVALQYKLDSLTNLYISWGKEFEAPSLYRMYSTSYSSGQLNVGNPNLKPQKMESIEFGVKKEIGKNADLALSVYHNDIKDLLYKKTIVESGVPKTGIYSGYSDSDTISRYENAGKAKTNGVEIEFNQKINDAWSMFTNYTYQNPKIKEAPSKSDEGKIVTYIPKEIFRIGVNYINGKWSSMLTGEYVSKRYSSTTNNDTINGVYGSYDPYFVLDWNMQYEVNKDSSITIGVDNLLNRQYYTYYYAPDRTYYMQLNYKF